MKATKAYPRSCISSYTALETGLAQHCADIDTSPKKIDNIYIYMCIIDLALYMEYEHTVVIEIYIYCKIQKYEYIYINIYICVCIYIYIEFPNKKYTYWSN